MLTEAKGWLELLDKYGVSAVVLIILMAFCWILFKTILKQQKTTVDLLTGVIEQNTRAADRNTQAMGLISRVVERCSWHQKPLK